MQGRAWCALATETHPLVLRQIHEDYIRAGAQVVTANTFASSIEILVPLGLGDKFADLNRRSVEIALEARERAGADRGILVAGSVSPTRPARIGKWMPEHATPERFEDECAEMAQLHREAGCDLVIAEMLGDMAYTPCVIRAARSSGLPVWSGLSAARGADNAVVAFCDESLVFADVAETAAALDADVMGIMHTPADVVEDALAQLRLFWNGPLMAYPDSLPPRKSEDHELDLDHAMEPETFADYCMQWRESGVQILGGCCGLSPEHIQALTDRLESGAGSPSPL